MSADSHSIFRGYSRYTRILQFQASLLTLLPLGIVLIALAARVIPGPRTIDDAFITFRYARNLLAGDGFVYNPGENVLGTTTPLYTLLMVLLGLFSGGVAAPFPILSLGLNALADSATCLLLVRLGRRLGAGWAGWAAALAWAVAPFSVTFAIGGLETSLYVLLLSGAALAHLERQGYVAALLGALAFLTRPDALILVGPLWAGRLGEVFREKRETSGGIGDKGKGERGRGDRTRLARAFKDIRAALLWKEILVFAIPVLAWLGFAAVYFGSPIPHSIAAKSLAYHLPREAAFVRLLQHYATPFLEHLTLGIPAIAFGLVLYPFLFLTGTRRALRAAPHAWPLLAYPWLYFAAFALANPLIFRWYLTPPLPFYFLVISIGAETLLRQIGTALGRRTSRQTWLQGVYPALVLVLFLLPTALSLRDWRLRPQHGLARPAPGMAWYELELLYLQAAERLQPELGSRPEARVLAAGDVGVLGFSTGARILDTVGLNSPVATRYYPLDPALYTINYAVAPDLILNEKPDFIVILEIYGREGLLKDARFLEAYDLVEMIPTDIYGSRGMLLFRRLGEPEVQWGVKDVCPL